MAALVIAEHDHGTLKGAKDPQLRAWAQKSLQSQQKELEELKKISPKQ